MANGLEATLGRELDHQSAVLMTADYREGVAAFSEKRPAKFTGE